jgi:hypothetical protein
MEYRKLVSVTGFSGLFEVVGSKSDGAILRSLDDNSTKFVSSRQHTLSHLESIEVFTVHENVNLIEIFKAIEKHDGSLPTEKDPKAVKAFFEVVYPDLDFDKVYNSDMKKMVRWYNTLKAQNIEITLPEIDAEEDDKEDASTEA